MNSALRVAHHLLELARAAKRELTPMQMLKLVYMCHGWMLGLYGRPLIRDEIQAWKYGPVIPSLYQEVKNFRSNPIAALRPTGDPALNPLEADLVRQVFEIYGGLDGVSLSHMTHMRGTPWEQTYHPHSWARVISNDLIHSHYAGLSKASKERCSA
jgi:uncharacterized phage-associated protein